MPELVLHQPPPAWGTPSISPFCMKLECYLRMTGTPYRAVIANVRAAPKGKVPFVTWEDGRSMGDSQLIIDELETRAGDKALDAGLSPREVAQGHAIRRMLEEAFYFIGLYMRWERDEAFALLPPAFAPMLPPPRGLILKVVRRAQRKKLHAQGTGRHTLGEVAALGNRDVDALSELLGDRPFFLGDAPRTIDAAVWGFLESTLGFPADSPVKARMASKANLVAFRARVRERWWRDL